MDKLDMTPEQQLAFDGFIDVMVPLDLLPLVEYNKRRLEAANLF